MPPEVAAYLGRPVLTSVVGLELADGVLRTRRETDEGEELWEVPLPAVLSVASTNVRGQALYKVVRGQALNSCYER